MWAQMISLRLKAGKNEQDLIRLSDALQAAEQPGSGLVRSTTMIDDKDPSRAHILVVFESEEAARKRESNEQRADNLETARKMMAETFDGTPEFLDLTVVTEHGGA